jgi:glycosyltransferase involved in cell wall biosynthesis
VKRALLVHHTVHSPGGASCVAAWALQALVADHAVTLLSWEPPELDAADRLFGTSLSQAAIAFESPPAWQRRAAAAVPVPLALLTTQLLLRRARALASTGRFDVVVGTMNELAVGRRAVQYIHSPWAYEPRPGVDLRWYHAPGLVRLYRRSAVRLTGTRPEEVARNVTLANSDWVGGLYRSGYGAEARTVPPPVPGAFPDVPWEDRDDRFLCIGRFAVEKEIPKVLRIFRAVRARGHDVRLAFVGHPDDPGVTRELEAAARVSDGAIEIRRDLTRSELCLLMARSRYGIHGMREEHFGIAAAELQRAGCIPFVPDSGGVAEIVEHDPRFTYGSEADAIGKIDRVLSDPQLRSALRTEVARRRDRYSVERFCADFRAAVGEVEATPAGS